MLKTTRKADEGNPHCTKINKIQARCLDIRQLIGERGGECVDGDEEIKGSSRLTAPFQVPSFTLGFPKIQQIFYEFYRHGVGRKILRNRLN